MAMRPSSCMALGSSITSLCLGFLFDSVGMIMAPTHLRILAQTFSRVRLSVTPRTVARQAPLSMGFSRR